MSYGGEMFEFSGFHFVFGGNRNHSSGFQLDRLQHLALRKQQLMIKA